MFAGILTACAVASAARFWFVCDDAFITFRFARNWATGRGLVFNPGEWPPVEGYSDFLWLLGATFLEAIGVSPAAVLPWVSAAAAVALVLRVFAVARGPLGLGTVPSFLATLTLALSPAMGCWSTSGLETMVFALFVFLLAEGLLLKDPGGGWLVPAVLGVAITLVRTEGVAWVVVVAGVVVFARWLEGRPLRPTVEHLLRILAPVGVVYVVYVAWRFSYYGTFVPNTALVKVSFGPRLLWRGAEYVLLFWLTCLVPLLSLYPARHLLRSVDRRGVWAGFTLLAIGFPAYGIAVGGDFMPFGRLLVPALPFGALLLAGGLSQLARTATPRTLWAVGLGLTLLGLLPAFDIHVVPYMVRRQLHFRLSDKDFLSELNRWANQKDNTDGFRKRGLALAQLAHEGDAVVAAAVGAIGYYSDLEVYDQHGLVTKEVAYRHLPPGPLEQSPGHDKHVDPWFFAKYAPRFLFARAVEGKLAAGRMKDSLDQWQVPLALMDRWVPDWVEVHLPNQEERTFLFMVRLTEPGEDPAEMWNGFAKRRKELNAELRAEYADVSDEAAAALSSGG
jgi:arabinofuranosyltransferase